MGSPMRSVSPGTMMMPPPSPRTAPRTPAANDSPTISKNTLLPPSIRESTSGRVPVCPQRDSNPRYRLEGPVSWARLDDGGSLPHHTTTGTWRSQRTPGARPLALPPELLDEPLVIRPKSVRPQAGEDEPDLGDLLAGAEGASREAGRVDHREVVAALPADGHGCQHFHLKPGLFQDLAGHCVGGILVAPHPPAGQSPGGVSPVGVPRDEDAPRAVPNEGHGTYQEVGVASPHERPLEPLGESAPEGGPHAPPPRPGVLPAAREREAGLRPSSHRHGTSRAQHSFTLAVTGLVSRGGARWRSTGAPDEPWVLPGCPDGRMWCGTSTSAGSGPWPAS